MAQSNGYGVLLGFQFQSFDSVNKEFQNIIKRLSDTGKIDLQFNADGAKINQAVNEIKEKMSKLNIDTNGFDKVVNQQVKTFASGAGQQILTLKNSANEVLKIVQSLNNQGEVIPNSVTGSVSSKAQTEAQVGLYKELTNLIKNEFDLKKQLISADELQSNELNKQLALNKEMQATTGKAIGKNGLQDSVLSDNLIQKRIELVNQYNSALAKSNDNMNKSLGSQGNKLESTITSLTTKLEALQSKYSGLVPTTQLNTFNEKLEVLKSSLNSVNNGKLIDGNKIQSQINQATQSFTKLTNATKENSSAVRTGNQDVMSFGSALTSVASKMGIYLSSAIAFRKLFQEIKNAVSYVETIDKNMTNMQMITGESANQVAETTKQFKELGAEMHTTNQEVLVGGEELLRAGYDAQEAKSMMSASILGAKVSGQDTSTVTEQLIAMKNAFNLDADSMEHYVDVISKMDNTSATSFKEIADAVQRTAFSAQQAGTPLDTLITYITTVSEKTRKSAETIGESFKTIYSRYSNIKLGNLDEDGKSINDVEIAMKRVGISIRDNKDSFRDFDSVLQEFMNKYKAGQMSQVDYLAGTQALGGTRQKETILALTQNLDALNQHQQNVANSAGSAQEMMSKAYDNSVDAKVQDLKRSVEGLYSTIINSNGLKVSFGLFQSFIDTITSLNQSFGTLPTVIGLATTALLVFKGTAITSFLTDMALALKQDIAMEGAFAVATTTLSGTLETLMGLLASNPIGLIAVAVGAVAYSVTQLNSDLQSTDTIMTNLSNSLTSLNDIKSQDKLVSQYEELQNKLKSGKLTTDEQTKAQSDLLDVEKQLGSTFSDMVTGYDSEGNAIATNINAIKDKIKANEALAKSEAEASYNSLINNTSTTKNNNTWGKIVETTLGLTNTALTDDTKRLFTGWIGGATSDLEEYQRLLEKTKNNQIFTSDDQKKYSDIKTEFQGINDAVAKLKESGADISDKKMFDWNSGQFVNAKDYFDKLAKGEDNASNSANGLTKSTNGLDSSLSGVTSTADTVTDSIKKMSDKFSTASDNMSLLKTAMEEFKNTGGQLSSDTIGKMLSTGDKDIISLLGDSNTFMEKASQLSSKYAQDQKNDLQQAIQTAQGETEATINSVNQKGDAYKTDTTNKANAESAKTQVTAENDHASIKTNVDAVNELGTHYSTDVFNKMVAESDKTKYSVDGNNAQLKSNSDTVNQLGDIYKTDSDNFRKAQEDKMNSVYKDSTNSMWDKYNTLNSIDDAEKKKTVFDMNPSSATLKSTYTPVKSTYNPVQSSYNPVGLSDKSASDLAKDEKSDTTKQQVADLESLVDRYYNLNIALSTVKNTVTSLQTAMKNVHGSEHIADIQNEINAYKQEQAQLQSNLSAMKSERDEKANLLRANGFIIDSMGQISNYQAQLNNLTAQANSLSGDAKTSAIENVKNLSQATKDYATLVSQTIPQAENEWANLNNTIQDTYKSVQKLVMDAESKISDIIKSNLQTRTDAIKEELSKQKQAYDDAYDANNYADTLKTAQDKVTGYDSQILQAIKAGDKESIKELTQAKQDAITELNKTISDHEKEQTDKSFDQASTDLDNKLKDLTKPQNLTALISDAMKTGVINVSGEVTKLSDAMNEFLQNSVTGTQTLNSEMQDLVNTLNDGVSAFDNAGLLSNIKTNSLDTSLFKSSQLANLQATQSALTSSSNKTNNVNLNLQSLLNVEKMDSSNIDEVKSMVDSKINSLVKELNDNLYR